MLPALGLTSLTQPCRCAARILCTGACTRVWHRQFLHPALPTNRTMQSSLLLQVLPARNTALFAGVASLARLATQATARCEQAPAQQLLASLAADVLVDPHPLEMVQVRNSHSESDCQHQLPRSEQADHTYTHTVNEVEIVKEGEKERDCPAAAQLRP